MSNDINDLLGGGGAPAFKFTRPGDTVRGTILTSENRQQRDYATSELKFWDDGKPMMEAIITLQTDLRDPAVEDDDGRRRVFVRGKMIAALREARTVAGVDLIEIGGRLAIQYTGDGEPSKRGFQAPKLFAAEYEAPTPSVNGLLAGQNTPGDPQRPTSLLGS